VAEAARTLKNIHSIYIKDHTAVVQDGKIVECRIIGKISFELDQLNHDAAARKHGQLQCRIIYT
jgi:flavin-binding protein dodecin